jgi:hypothetical protein
MKRTTRKTRKRKTTTTTTRKMKTTIHHVFDQLVTNSNQEQDLNDEQRNQLNIEHCFLQQTTSNHRIDQPIDRQHMILLFDNKCHMVYRNNLFHHRRICLTCLLRINIVEITISTNLHIHQMMKHDDNLCRQCNKHLIITKNINKHSSTQATSFTSLITSSFCNKLVRLLTTRTSNILLASLTKASTTFAITLKVVWQIRL